MEHDELGFRVYTAKELKDFLIRNGYRECDIAACNCGSWHGGHASDRLRELRDVIGENGKTLLQSATDLQQQLAQLQEENEQLKCKAKAFDEMNKQRQDIIHEKHELKAELAQLQLEVGRKDEALSKISDSAILGCGHHYIAKQALSQQTPPLYSAVVELVKALDGQKWPLHPIDWQLQLSTLKKLMGIAE